jgi:hypothetical protein
VTYHLGPVDPDRRAELFGDPSHEEPPRRPRRLLATTLALLIMGLFSGGLWFAYVHGSHHVGGNAATAVPLIHADERPTKVKPEQPGGMEIPDRDKLIYNNPTRKVVEHLLPPPEKPMARPAPPPPGPPEPARSPAGAAPSAAATPENSPPANQIAQPQQLAAAPPAAKAVPALQGPSKPMAKTGGPHLQLGSLRSEDAARQEWERIKRKNADLLGNLSATAIRADLGEKGVYYRIQTGPVADPAAAERICGELKQRSIGCIIAR